MARRKKKEPEAPKKEEKPPELLTLNGYLARKQISMDRRGAFLLAAKARNLNKLHTFEQWEALFG
tara:strand:- start:40 stop:234 length:195 start_codon:yes stop_codon:yes gene_type:complete